MAKCMPLLLSPYEKPPTRVYVLGRTDDVAALGDLDNLDPAIDCKAWPSHHTLPDDAWHVVVLWHPSLESTLMASRYPPMVLCRELDGVPQEIQGVPTVRVLFIGSSRNALLQLLMCTVLSTSYQGPIGVDEADVKVMLERAESHGSSCTKPRIWPWPREASTAKRVVLWRPWAPRRPSGSPSLHRFEMAPCVVSTMQ